MEIELVDADLREATMKLPKTDPSKAATRLLIRTATRLMRAPRFDGVTVSVREVDGIRLRVYVPDERKSEAGLFWIHGGGLVFGNAKQDEPLCALTAKQLGIAVVSASYRFAPEHPFPIPLDDVRAAWDATIAHASELEIDPTRLAIGGESAGGGLAASLVNQLHDAGGVQPIAQWLFAPMIDDRTAADESLDATNHWIWNNRANRYAWNAYLGGAAGAPEIAPYAAAARREDLSGLPPTFIAVGDIELFLAEDEDYAHRLDRAGVDVELDVVAGAPHGFENWARTTGPAEALMTRARRWLASALAG